jgi:hypothetical protein
MADLNSFRENLRSLVSKFEQDKHHYFSERLVITPALN